MRRTIERPVPAAPAWHRRRVRLAPFVLGTVLLGGAPLATRAQEEGETFCTAEEVAAAARLGDGADGVTSALPPTVDAAPVFIRGENDVVIENLAIDSDEDARCAVDIADADNVVIRNLDVRHANVGICVYDVTTLTIENVRLVASAPPATGPYCRSGVSECGTDRAAQLADPDTKLGITLDRAPGARVDRVSSVRASSGLFVHRSEGTAITNLACNDIRGPMPRGQCAQIAYSDGTTLTGFYSRGTRGTSHYEDNVNVYHSDGVTVSEGLIDGNYSENGVGVIADEGSDDLTVRNVDLTRTTNGAISVYSNDPSRVGANFTAENVRVRDTDCEGRYGIAPSSGGRVFVAHPLAENARFVNAQYVNHCNEDANWTNGASADIREEDFTLREPPVEGDVDFRAPLRCQVSDSVAEEVLEGEAAAFLEDNPDIVPTSEEEQAAYQERLADDLADAGFDVVPPIPLLAGGGADAAPTGPPDAGAGTRYSVLDAVLDASSPDAFDCLDLRITGACLYLTIRITCTPLGCSVKVQPEASIELSHYNADLLIGTSRRLGASPIEEARLLFGELQLGITGPLGALLTGHAESAAYRDPDRWAAGASEGGPSAIRSSMKYNEVDVLGHPGHIYQHLSADRPEPVSGLLAHIAEAPGNVRAGLGESVTEMTTELDRSAPALEGGIDVLNEEPGWEHLPYEVSLVDVANLQFLGPVAEMAGVVSSAAGEITGAFDLWERASAGDLAGLVEGITDASTVLDEATGVREAADGFTEGLEAIGSIDEFLEGVGVPGLGVSSTELFSLCPSDARALQPYHLSGLDLFQWRWNIPEIVDPRGYAFPLPGSTLFVGDPPLNNWGNIFPRTGFTVQSDQLKAAAVTTFRAAHVVTRTGEKHVYSPITPKRTPYLDVEHPAPLEPNDERTGKWQMLAPEMADACVVFGQDEPLIPGTAALSGRWTDPDKRPWTFGKHSEDGHYVAALWREYVCCPEPRRQGETIFRSISLGKVPFEIQIVGG